MIKIVDIIVKIDKNSTKEIPKIIDECENAGMKVDQQMKTIGMITGSIEQTNISKIESISGVLYVEESKVI